MLLRTIKIILSLSVAIWGLTSGTMNLLYYNPGPVAHVMSIEGAESMRAITSPILISIGYAVIYLGKYATGLLAAYGTYKLWQARGDAKQFNMSKSITIAGCGAGVFTMFFGFYAMAHGLFFTGSVSDFSTAYIAYAFYFLGALGIIGIFIAVPDIEDS